MRLEVRLHRLQVWHAVDHGHLRWYRSLEAWHTCDLRDSHVRRKLVWKMGLLEAEGTGLEILVCTTICAIILMTNVFILLLPVLSLVPLLPIVLALFLGLFMWSSLLPFWRGPSFRPLVWAAEGRRGPRGVVRRPVRWRGLFVWLRKHELLQ